METKLRENKIISAHELNKLRYPLLPSLLKAAGILRHKRKELTRHLEKVRNEWDSGALIK